MDFSNTKPSHKPSHPSQAVEGGLYIVFQDLIYLGLRAGNFPVGRLHSIPAPKAERGRKRLSQKTAYYCKQVTERWHSAEERYGSSARDTFAKAAAPIESLELHEQQYGSMVSMNLLGTLDSYVLNCLAREVYVMSICQESS